MRGRYQPIPIKRLMEGMARTNNGNLVWRVLSNLLTGERRANKYRRRSRRPCEASYLKNVILLLSVACISITLSGCTFSAKLHYRPIAKSSLGSARQGYSDHQIDERTYLVTFQGQLGNPAKYWADVEDVKWIKIAQQYTLYRAAELAKSKGAQYFIALHKDDWNLIRVDPFSGKYGPYPIFEPGAGIVMRMLHELPSSIERNDDRVLDVDTLLQNRIEKNSGMVKYSKNVSQKALLQNGNDGFHRWRSSVNRYGSAPIPVSRHKNIFGEYIKPEPGTKIAQQTVPGQFELVIWDDRLISPLRFLSESIKLADQEGYEAFKLANWTAEEYCAARRPECGKVWFRTKATLILQHRKEPDSLDPVFVVDEIRLNVLSASAKF